MNNKQDDIFQAILKERNYQDEKWGWLDKRSVQGWLLVMESELNEAKEAWVKTGLDELALREILQTIAVGVACLEEHGIFERQELVEA